MIARLITCRFAFISMLALATSLFAEPIKLAKQIPARVDLRQPGKAPEVISGTLTAANEDSITIKTKTDDRTLQWADLTGLSGYQLRIQLIDKTDAQEWLKMGTLAWELGDKNDARSALAQAQRLDAKLKDDVDAVLASGAGILLDAAGLELIHDAPEGEPVAPKDKYQKISPEQAKAAMALVRADAKQVSGDMKIELKEVESQHFLIFTDWDPREYKFLQDNLEAAYTCVSKQFDIPPDENVFVGKLGVFMFTKHEDFLHFGVTYDNIPANRQDIAGYYAQRGRLLGHMAMSKPGKEIGAIGHDAEVAWAYVLTHEFTHAFVAEYRTGRRIPTWLNEGIAEVVASSQFPRDVRADAAAVARSKTSLAPLFDDDAGIQSGSMYPVMRTLVELLIKKDRQKFLKMFDEIKAGATASQALKDNYNCTFDDLETAWRQYVTH